MAPHARSIADEPCATRVNCEDARCAQGQLPLRYNDRYLAGEATEKLYDAASAVVSNATLKQAAFDLDQPASTLCKALKRQERHYGQLDWLFWLVTHDGSNWIVKLVCRWAGGEFCQSHQMSDRERADALERALDKVAGEKLASVVRQEAGLK